MGMRETPGSLRAYFIIAGIIGAARGAMTLNVLRTVSTREGVPMKLLGALGFEGVALLALGIAAIVCGLGLPTALRRGAQGAQQMLLAAFAVNLVDAALTAWILGDDQGGGFVPVIIGIAITAYLLFNVRRLAKDAMEKDGPVAIARS